jgi:DNA-directed RNA polymerase I, II, and III subunit RPABC1
MEIAIIRENLKDMLEARGDDVSYIEEHGDAVDPKRYYNELIMLDTNKTVVFFTLSKEILKDWKTKEESDEAAFIKKYSRKHFILILTEAPSSALMHQLQARDKALQVMNGSLQIFYVKELLYNPMKHNLVPKHEKISEEEAKQILSLYLIKHKNQLPIISRNDVIARWLGLRHGDIVKITRYNETSGTYYYYRCCL